MTDFSRALRALLPESCVHEQEPMSGHTTFRVGGPADYYAEPETAEQLAAVIRLCKETGMDYYILGNGSNLLIPDEGYRGVMIAIGKAFGEAALYDEVCIRAGAGAMLSAVSRLALQEGLTGLEFASGIPGTLGGAAVMNAGAYGSEMKAVLMTVTVLTPEGSVVTLPAEELELGYRTSCIPKRNYVVLSAEMKLEKGDAEAIKARMDELAVQRRTKQPLEYPSAGSTFKRPEGYFAGKLIQDAGLRGYTVGGAQVSEKHCGFVINRGGATASDILTLVSDVQKRVKEQFGVDLEMEIKIP